MCVSTFVSRFPFSGIFELCDMLVLTTHWLLATIGCNVQMAAVDFVLAILDVDKVLP